MENSNSSLYHYTSIESLAMILSSKKIRFNSLNKVDDMTEGMSFENEEIGKYFFISSWTDLKEESLPFWNMYTSMKGVRIKMPSDLFEQFTVSTKSLDGTILSFHDSIIPEEEFITNKYIILPTHNNYLYKINYTNTIEKLKPKIISIRDNEEIVSYGKIGLYKALHWKFQSEYRFRLVVFPKLEDKTDIQVDSLNDLDKIRLAIKRNIDLPFSDYYVNINESKMNQMEVLLGPKHTKADKLIVESLLSRYNPNARLKISVLHNTIR